MDRLVLSDTAWERMAPLIIGRPDQKGSSATPFVGYAAKKKRAKRDVFLAELAAVVPWVALEAVIEPHYPEAGPNGGRRPFPLAVMLRIYCL